MKSKKDLKKNKNSKILIQNVKKKLAIPTKF